MATPEGRAQVLGRPVVNTTGRRAGALLTAVALGASGFLASAPSDAAPTRATAAVQEATDVWSGDWLAEGQNVEGGEFLEFGVITFELVEPGGNDVDVCLHDEEGNLHYAGSYEYGGGGTVSGCSDTAGTLYGKYYSKNYFTAGGTWGQFFIEMEGDSWEGCYSPPSDNPRGTECTLEWRGKKAEPQPETCEAPAASRVASRRSGSGTRAARLTPTSLELARPYSIEGVWLLCGKRISVTPVGSTGALIGTALDDFSFLFPDCETDYRAGDTIWDLGSEDGANYVGIVDCDGGGLQPGGAFQHANWRVTVSPEDWTRESMILCLVPAGDHRCADLAREGRATRDFQMTLNGRPGRPMNAIPVDQNLKEEAVHRLYVTTVAKLENGGFRAEWNPGKEQFEGLSKPTGELTIKDLYFVGHKDEVTKLVITKFPPAKAAPAPTNVVNPGRDEAGVPPHATIAVRVKVLSSDWKNCHDGKEGVVGFAWYVDAGDTLGVRVCGRLRTYVHEHPDDKSRVDVELVELQPK